MSTGVTVSRHGAEPRLTHVPHYLCHILTQEEEYDPLDAFMAEVDAEVAAAKPTHKAKPSAAMACDEETDGAAEYMAVRKGDGGVHGGEEGGWQSTWR